VAPRLGTPRRLVLNAERRFRRAGLVFGHGTDNARDEAVFLVFHALGLPFKVDDRTLDTPVPASAAADVERLVQRRIDERRPAAFLTGRMWFCGHEFAVDERVLVPRSPIGELINQQFAPWLEAGHVRRVLDIATGSGCIAIATALALPGVEVDATDISPEALCVARANAERLGVSGRVRFHLADIYPGSTQPYDLILSNPPYVPQAEFDALPAEYRHEPALGLVSGTDGLDVVRRLLARLPEHLSRTGTLIMDTGATSDAMAAAFPELPFTWLEMVHGGDGISILNGADLRGRRGDGGRGSR
jgi:ribosomal protein L3 glutamine methyltransferase